MRRFRPLTLLLLIAALLSACGSPALSGDEGPTPLPVPIETWTASPSATADSSPTPTTGGPPPPAVERVLIVSFDGMRPDAIFPAPMAKLLALESSGSYSLSAQTTYPSSTLPSHASMLTGLCPDDHGVDWNDYDPAQGYAQGIDLFDLAHAAGLRTAMVVGKDKLRQLTEPASLDLFEYVNDRGLVVAQRAVDLVFPGGFGLLFVHFPTPDWMGHEHGWMSPEYMDVLRQDDRALGILLIALDEAGLGETTLVIVTADHGGHDGTHGSDRPEDMTIPWIVSGPGVLAGPIPNPVSTVDTAATAAWALGLDIPTEWSGVPVYEAFGLPYQERPSPRCP
jgi:arylsulfatase A-like enzyme